MTFTISPSALNTHATALRDDAATTSQAKTYATDHMTVEFAEAALLFQQARVQVNDLRDSVRGYLDALKTADSASADELDAVAEHSLAMDDDVEARLDAEYPDSGRPAVPIPPGSTPDVACIASPEAALTAPPTSAPTDLATQILTTNWLSPSTLIDQAIGLIAGLAGLESPLTTVGKRFGGDWDKLYECGAAVESLARYLELHAMGRRASMAATATSWKGEAATAATTFFATQATALDDTAAVLKATAPEFDAVVRGMRSAANLASGLFATVLDASLIAWGCYAAGGVTAWTGVGAIIGGICGTGAVGVATYAAVELFGVCQDLLTILDTLTALIGVAVAFMFGDGIVPTVGAYDNPGV